MSPAAKGFRPRVAGHEAVPGVSLWLLSLKSGSRAGVPRLLITFEREKIRDLGAGAELAINISLPTGPLQAFYVT
jgi:hypothetical protein